ncbi:uncharacterized protein LOC144545680 [Carex rostrata]
MAYQDISLLFRQALSQQASQQLSGLLNDIQSDPITLTTRPDNAAWRWEATGEFTVRSAYFASKNTLTTHYDTRRIWKLKVPPRMRVFAWLMVLNKILTVDNLMRRGWSMVNRCVLCKNSSESVLHLFEQCQVSVQVYTQAAQAVHMVIPITGAIREIIENNYNAQFVIWPERCTRIFRDISKQKEQLVHEIVTEYQLQERTQDREE